jgi:Tetratricopeptide repeat
MRALHARLGEEHPSTLSCAINLANCQADLGQPGHAEALLNQTLARLTATLGAQHPDTLICQANLAVAMRENTRTEEATLLQQRVITALTRQLSQTHPYVTALNLWHRQDRDLEPQLI